MLEKLLSCPICGKQPKLSSLEPERQSMKYFCGVHIACGDWKSTKELAILDWNRRVKEYEDYLIAVKTPFTEEWLNEQAQFKTSAYCEECGYETEVMTMKDLIFKLSMEGGYIASDKDGGYFSQCPKCGSEKLSLECN